MFREFFYLQKSDRKVILALLCVAVVALLVFFLADGESTTALPTADDSLDTAAPMAEDTMRTPRYYQVEGRRAELFPFDPNTADSTQLLRLGLQPWQVRNIYKYRAAGGIYRRPADFARLYGLTVGQYRRLEPYIRISADYQPASTLVETPTHERDTLRYPVKIQPDEHVVLNQADTAQLKRVPGIGSYFARQIVQYGTRLGGYVSVDQLDEIEGFPADSKSYFVVESPAPRKLNLNRLTLNELKRHPYINYYQAKAITDYRRLHGTLQSLQDLRLSKDFPPEVIQRLAPYVEF